MLWIIICSAFCWEKNVQQRLSWVIAKDSMMRDASTSFHYSCRRLTPRLFLLLTLPQVLWNWSRRLQVKAHPASSSFARNAARSYALTSNLQDHCQLIQYLPASSSWNLNKGWCCLFLLCINSPGVHLIWMEGIQNQDDGREAPLRLIDQIKIPNLQTQMWVGDLCNETPHNIHTQGKKCVELWKTVFVLLTSFIFTSIIRPKDHMWV